MSLQGDRVQTMPDPWTPTPCVIRAAHAETADTVTLEIESPPGFSSSPGQFTMVTVFGVGEVPISISGDASSLVHTVRAVGAVTKALAALGPGDVVGIRGPFGSAWPLVEAAGADAVVIAGGLGLAPLRTAVRAILNERQRYGRAALLYGARTPADLLYAEELRTWRARFDLDVNVTVDSAGVAWRGDVGVVPALIARAAFDPASAISFVCGPEIMMRATVAALRGRGVAEDRIFVSLERNMRCAIGLCGHCQFGPMFVCKDGPVFRADRVAPWLGIREM